MACLTLENVNFQYKNKAQTVRAVQEATAQFERGKFYAIIGKSGSGKTTLVSLLAGLDKPADGEVAFEGTNLKNLNVYDYRLHHVSVIYQSYNLFPLMTALENVMFPLYVRKTPKKQAREAAKQALAMVGLDERFYKRLPSMLSGGEQQRVAIARALASGSEVLLADEPTGNLDEENGKIVVSLLKTLAHEQNRCVIVVTHDLSIAAQADVVFEMRDGFIREKQPEA